MSTLRIGTITICTLATLAGALALDRHAISEAPNRWALTAPVAATTLAGTSEILTSDDRRLVTPAGAAPASEFLPESDTTGLLRESLTIDDLLDEVNADSGDGFTPVDRENFAALLRSDPELRKAIAD